MEPMGLSAYKLALAIHVSYTPKPYEILTDLQNTLKD